jgi:hypothetical protein
MKTLCKPLELSFIPVQVSSIGKSAMAGRETRGVTEQRKAMVMPMRYSIAIVNDFSELGR